MRLGALIICLGLAVGSRAASVLIPMDQAQTNHLKAYGLAYWALKENHTIDWLLNYRGGSFLVDYTPALRNECQVRGVLFEMLSAEQTNTLLREISSPSVNMELVRLEKAPRVAVYTPTRHALVTDDTDAVVLALEYAEIPYAKIYDEEVLADTLAHFDWLHLHHEDFTGQMGRSFRRATQVLEAKLQETLALKMGYTKVATMKRDVSRKIYGFCAGGGYLFAMCSGAETFDIALAADGLDIVASEYDGDDADPLAQGKLDFTRSLAFENFTLEPPDSRKFSDINTSNGGWYGSQPLGFFQLFSFSAKWDIVPTMLVQNHEQQIREFFGQTTAFQSSLVKPSVQVLGENKQNGNVRYIYGELGRGHWTYYSGHDPESMPGRGRGGGNTNLALFPHSPGYRLILNNVLFPSAKKKKQKT